MNFGNDGVFRQAREAEVVAGDDRDPVALNGVMLGPRGEPNDASKRNGVENGVNQAGVKQETPVRSGGASRPIYRGLLRLTQNSKARIERTAEAGAAC